MNTVRTPDSPQPANNGRQTPDARGGHPADMQTPSNGTESSEAVVLVRGESVRDKNSAPPAKAKESKAVSDAKVAVENRLPVLEDDADVGIRKDQVVTRDGKPDIAFNGTLLASAAPDGALKGKWQEYRIYETSGGQYVFSRVSRSVFREDLDEHEAEVFDPSPSSMPSQLLRSVRDVARSQPLTWKDAAADFFGYDPLAKALYRKLGDQFEEHIR